MEVNLGGLQETVLEVVQIEEHAVLIELCLRIAVGEVEVSGTTDLDIRQFPDRTLQQFLLLQRVTASRLTTTTNGIEEGERAEVGLQITQLIVAGGQHLRHRQLLSGEVLSQIDEGMILVTTRADDTHHRLTVSIRQPVIGTVTATARNLLDVGRLCALPLRVEFNEFLHNECKGTNK